MKKYIALIVGILIIVQGLFLIDTSFAKFMAHIARIQPAFVVFYIIFNFLNIYLIIHRWAVMVRAGFPNATFPRGFFLISQIAALFSNVIPLGVGNISVKVLSLKMLNKTDMDKSFLLALVEHGLNFAITSLFMLPCLVIFFRLQPRDLLIVTALSAVALIIWLILKTRKIWLQWFGTVNHLGFQLIAKFAPQLTTKLHDMSSWQFLTQFMLCRQIPWILFYSLFIYFVNNANYYLLILAMGIEVNPGIFFLSFPLIYFLTLISPTPAGLGTRDMGWVGILMFHGVDEGLALSFAVVARIIDQSFLVVLSLAGYLYFQKLGFTHFAGYHPREKSMQPGND